MVFQQLGGLNAYGFYMSSILERAGNFTHAKLSSNENFPSQDEMINWQQLASETGASSTAGSITTAIVKVCIPV